MHNSARDPLVQVVSIDLLGGWSGRVLVECHTPTPTGTVELPDVDAWRPWLERLISDPANLPDYSVLKYSKTNEVFRTRFTWSKDAKEHRIDVVCKRTRVEGFGGELVARWRPSRARRNFDRALQLLRAGIGSALPLAMIERRSRPGEAWLVTEHLANVVDLDMIALTGLPQLDPGQSFKAKSALLDAVVELFTRLVSLNLHHRDLKASNILLANWDHTDRMARPMLVDLDGLGPRRWWRPSQRWQPLIRLAASLLDYPAITRTDYVRFLRRYLARTGCGRDEWKTHFRVLARRAVQYADRAQLRKTHKLDGHAGNRPRG